MGAKITERGWAGHFICAARCSFRRNTLVERGDDRVVVSTVGSMRERDGYGKVSAIGAFGRYYETMVFRAKKEGPYWEADVQEQISFKSPWALVWEKPEDIPASADNLANDMHEAVVAEMARGDQDGQHPQG